LALREMLDKLLKVLPADSEIEIERVLKWVLCIHHLLLRFDHGTRKGGRMHTAMCKRLELFEKGFFRILVGPWRTDVAAALARPGGKVLNTAASVKPATRLIEDRPLAKVMPCLEGSGLDSLILAERCSWKALTGLRRPFLNHVRDALRNLTRNAGVLVGRFRNVTAAAGPRGDGHHHPHNGADSTEGAAVHVANSDLPPWFYTAGLRKYSSPRSRQRGAPQPHTTYALWAAVAQGAGSSASACSWRRGLLCERLASL